jgi:hypothetical protein
MITCGPDHNGEFSRSKQGRPIDVHAYRRAIRPLSVCHPSDALPWLWHSAGPTGAGPRGKTMITLTGHTFLSAIRDAAEYGEDAVGQCERHTLTVSPGINGDSGLFTELTLAPVDQYAADTYSIHVPYVADAERAQAIYHNAVDRLITARDSADLFDALAIDGFGYTF